MSSSIYSSPQLVYLVYGNDESYQLEAKFSILTALRRSSAPLKILLYTDRPDRFIDWPVEVVYIDEVTLAKWTGVHGYFHRRKACVVHDALTRSDCSIFIDTDTFFLNDPHLLFRLVREKGWLVDKIEAKWGDWSDQPIYAKLSDLLSAKYGIDDEMLLINSGVLGMDKRGLPLCLQIIDRIDEFFQFAPDIHIIEQFAVGVVASILGKPSVSKKVVRHYHSEKKFWANAVNLFFKNHGKTYSARQVDRTREVPIVRPKPAWPFRLAFKFLCIGLPKDYQTLLRLAYYAVHIPSGPYSDAFRLTYIGTLTRRHPKMISTLTSQPDCFRTRILFPNKTRHELRRLVALSAAQSADQTT